MTSRLQLINSALIGTGNVPCDVENDGSDEWRSGSAAFERGVNWMLGRHPWAFATVVTPDLPRLSEAASPHFDNSFALPTDRLLIRGVYYEGRPLMAWGLVDDKLCCDPEGFITAQIVRRAPEAQWSPAFIEALTAYVEAGIYRGLNEDETSGDRREKRADALLQDAQFQSDVQTSGRAWFVGRVAARRRGGGHSRG